jgi:glycine dehydrogenase
LSQKIDKSSPFEKPGNLALNNVLYAHLTTSYFLTKEGARMPVYPYNLNQLPKEKAKHYISATNEEILQMCQELAIDDPMELFNHIPSEYFFENPIDIGDELDYDKITDYLTSVSKKNRILPSFIGDGLKSYSVGSAVSKITQIRGLTTAYTPYQPERSQGTLQTLWIYSNALKKLTGMEAINASMYDRSTAIFEAISTMIRFCRRKKTVLVVDSLFPGDKSVIETMIKETESRVVYAPVDAQSGVVDLEKFEQLILDHQSDLAGVLFSQINCFGNIAPFNQLTDTADKYKLLKTAVIDPITLADGGLTPPSEFGSSQTGVEIIVGEGQHLAMGPNFGGPGLGIFGVRFNQNQKSLIRSTPGRYVGKASDSAGRDCLCMILSTREQHIRREKATSNICSNQSFLATMVGANLLQLGSVGLKTTLQSSLHNKKHVLTHILKLKGVELAFSDTASLNEVCLKITSGKFNVSELIKKANTNGIHLGVDVSKRYNTSENQLMLFFNDLQTQEVIDKLVKFFEDNFEKNESSQLPNLDLLPELQRTTPTNLPHFSEEQVVNFYTLLGEQNVSPDDNIYPLGSCTMKYNPYLNDYTAGLEHFVNSHPQVPEEDAQGSLEVLYQIQEKFKAITGLPAVTTMPVAGAQGELVGLKMFQAYHRAKGNQETKKIILIPRSAHGTNPATASVAGFLNCKKEGLDYGIITVEANDTGLINMDQLKELIKTHGERIAGIMVTNPNTSGLFETSFLEMANLIHSVDGLVYMDGANMNAIAGVIDLNSMGVDAVHNNLHKTWSIPHGGGGPGDAIVAVSDKLIDFMPGIQVENNNGVFKTTRPPQSMGDIHRHFGNFAHKVRCLTYLLRLGSDGVKKMSCISVLASSYLFSRLKKLYPTLPSGAHETPHMHEFIITLKDEQFKKIEDTGIPKAQVMAYVGKLFLDFGIHAPTVSFPEVYGHMIEPTESFSKEDLDRFSEVVEAIYDIINERPDIIKNAPHFTPISKVNEVKANKDLILFEEFPKVLPDVLKNLISPADLDNMKVSEIKNKLMNLH